MSYLYCGRNIFQNFYIAVDTSKETDDTFNEYSSKDNNAILFCACKL